MPLFSIETNQPLKGTDTLELISKDIAALLSKPESYVMIKYEHNRHMLFAGSDKALAHIKLKSLSLPEDQTTLFSKKICALIQQYFEVPVDRIYIEYANPERHMWGWNSSTF